MTKVDVIVVGAGPGGASCAYHLAKAGYKVIFFDKKDFPRDKSCGDGLTRMSAKLLHDMGVWDKLTGSPNIKGVRILMKDQGVRDFDYPDDLEEPKFGMVVPRLILDNVLKEKAEEAGAIFYGNCNVTTVIQDDKGVVVGVKVKLENGEEQDFFCNCVVAADGAGSKIAYQLDLPPTPKDKMGFGIRSYYTGIKDIHEHLEIYLPILDSSNKYVLPSYGWVFPIDGNSANIGVGLVEKAHDENVQKVMSRFVDFLKETDPRFKDMELNGKTIGAPMRFDFASECTYAPGLMLVGDAAGMISPFTGEGIGYAIETGMIASEVYDQTIKRGELSFADLSSYGRKLQQKYQGYFETGRESNRRYHLTYQVLRDTFNNEQPLFEYVRQSTLFPEAIGESFVNRFTEDLSKFVTEDKPRLRTDMLSVSTKFIDIIGKEWPFMARFFSTEKMTPGLPFRPSLFVLLAGYLFEPNRKTLVNLGLCLELGVMAAMCHNSVEEDENGEGGKHRLNRGNMFSILLGDFLLGKSYEISAHLESNYSELIADALMRSSTGYIKSMKLAFNTSLSVEEYLESLYLKNAGLYELCFQLGAICSKGSVKSADVLSKFGKHFGAAYQIIDDNLGYIKKGKDLSSITNSQEDKGVLSLAMLLQLQASEATPPKDATELPEIEFTYLMKANDIARAEMEKGRAILAEVDTITSKESLHAICDYVLKQTDQIASTQ
jgi:geranylgeranyl reductase family protein